MTSENKKLTESQLILHLLELISDSERTIKFYKGKGMDLMVKQYQHIRQKDINALNQLLHELGWGLKMVEDA